jgi:hypothetical protein
MNIVVANPDWDTPEHEEMLLWYQNPGPHSEAIENPWKKHVVFKNQQLFAKP